MRERHDPRTRLKQLVESWPEISDDLAMLPRILHRALRRMDAEEAAVKRQRRAPLVVAEPRRVARLEQLVVGAALLIAGVLWTGLAEPQWIGWIGAGIGLAVLVLAPRR
jgi:hypothetical protein